MAVTKFVDPVQVGIFYASGMFLWIRINYDKHIFLTNDTSDRIQLSIKRYVEERYFRRIFVTRTRFYYFMDILNHIVVNSH